MANREEVVQKLQRYTQKVKAQKSISLPPVAAPAAQIAQAVSGTVQPTSRLNNAFDAMMLEQRVHRQPITQLIDAGEMYAQKSLSFNKYVMDFINDSGVYGRPQPYTDQQLLMAYMSSVYLFAALRRVSNLIGRIKIVAEVREGNKYVRAPETLLINRIFDQAGPVIFPQMYLNYAIYGMTVVYKSKSMKAILDQAMESPTYDYKDDALANLYVLDRPMWELDEDTYNNEIRGIYVNRGDEHLPSRNYLQRREFVHWTDWNPENPNRGRSIATVAIHEAVTNAAIARWSAEYFTRGAMPFVLVAMEEDPAMIADNDLMKYKRQFEEHWQGVNSSLRSVFIDRKVDVQQVGIPAGEVAAAELNESALEGISAAVGLDRELIVTPAGGTQERHSILVKRAWEDTVIPTALKMLHAFTEDLGLPDDMRLVLDLSHIAELDADRDEKVQTEMALFEGSMQTYNETRTRLNQPTIAALDGFIKTDEGLMPIQNVVNAGRLPHPRIRESYAEWYEKGLATFNDYRQAMGMRPVNGMEDIIYIDGKPMKVQTFMKMLNWNEGQIAVQTDLYDRGLRTFNEIRAEIGLAPIDGLSDVFLMDSKPVRLNSIIRMLEMPPAEQVELEMRLFESGIQSVNEIRRTVGLEPIAELDGWFMSENRLVTIDQMLRKDQFMDDKMTEQIGNLFADDLILRSKAMSILGLELAEGEIDGYKTQVSNMMQYQSDSRMKKFETEMELYRERQIKEIELEFAEKTRRQEERLNKEFGGSGGGGGGGGWRSLDDDGPDGPGGDSPNRPFRPDGYVSSFDTLRHAPFEDSAPLSDLAVNDVVEVVGKTDDGQWFQVYLPNMETGWVPAQAVMTDRDLEQIPSTWDDSDYSFSNLIDVLDEQERSAGQVAAASSKGILPLDPKRSSSFMENLDTDLSEEPNFEYGEDRSQNTVLMQSPLDVGMSEMDAMDLTRNLVNRMQEERSHQTAIHTGDRDVYEQSSLSDNRDNETLLHSLIPTDTTLAEGGNRAYVSIDLTDQADLRDYLAEVKQLVGDNPDVEWTDLSRLHLTLLYVKDIDDEQFEAARNILPSTLDKVVELSVGPLTSFDNEFERILVLAVRLDNSLQQLQQRIGAAFSAYGPPVSDYSRYENYVPHITLGYAPPTFVLPKLDRTIKLYPENILFGRKDYQTVYTMPVIPKTASQPDGDDAFEPDDEESTLERREVIKAYLSDWMERGEASEAFALSDASLKGFIEKRLKVIRDGYRDDFFKAMIRAADGGALDSEHVRFQDVKAYLPHEGKAMQSSAQEELRAWERKTLKGGIKKGITFDAQVIPHSVRAIVRKGLRSITDDTDVRSVFVEAREALRHLDETADEVDAVSDPVAAIMETPVETPVETTEITDNHLEQ